MVVSQGYCLKCGHPKGCIGHYPNFKRFKDPKEPVCLNCNRCKDPLSYHIVKVLELSRGSNK